MTSAYEQNRKNRPDVKGYSIQELWNNQIGPNFIERYQNRELGKEKADQILSGLEQTWTDLDDVHKKNLITLGNTIGDIYKDLRTVEGIEYLNPIATTTAAAIRTGEFALNTVGKVSDFLIGNPARGVGWLAGLDPRWREGMAVGAQLYFGPKAINKVSKLKPKHLGITTKIEPYVAPTQIGNTKKMINITADAVDETFNLNPEIFRQASKIYKANPNIGMKKAIQEAKLLSGFKPSQLITDKTFGSIKKGGLFDPNRNDTNKFLFAGSMDLGLPLFGGQSRKNESVEQYRNRLFNQAGFRRNENGDFIFDDRTLIKNVKGDRRREISQVAQTKPGQTVKGSFNKTRDATRLGFTEELGGYMKLTGSKPNLHHRFAAMVVAPIYRGLPLSDTPGSEWMELTGLFNERNIYPGSPVTDPESLGGPGSNLEQIVTKGYNQKVVLPDGTEKIIRRPPEPHDVLHHQYYKEMGLQDVEEGKASWFDKRMYKITGSRQGRMEVARELADIINEGDRIIDASMDQIRALFGNKTDPNYIVKLLMELVRTGKLKITGTNYRLKSIEKIVEIIKKEVQANLPLADEQEILNIVEQYKLDYAQEIEAIDLLHNIADYNESMRIFGKRPPSITHLQHKRNIKRYMELIQTKIPLEIPVKEAKEQGLRTYTYKRVKPVPIDKQLEIIFSDDR